MTLRVLQAHDKELAIRPPVDEWAAAYFKYQRPRFDDEDDASPEIETPPESTLLEFEP